MVLDLITIRVYFIIFARFSKLGSETVTLNCDYLGAKLQVFFNFIELQSNFMANSYYIYYI